MSAEGVDRQAVEALSRQLELCRIAPGSTGVVLADDYTEPVLVDAAVAALTRVGAVPSVIEAGDSPLDQLGDVLSEAGSTGIVVNLLEEEPDELEAMVGAHARVLTVVGPGIGLLRGVVPHAGLGRRARRGMDLLESGVELHLSDMDGSNLRIGLRGARRWKHDGLASAPGSVAQWPRG